MTGGIDQIRPIHLGHDLEGNPIVARPEPRESLADFLARAQEMAEGIDEARQDHGFKLSRLLEEAALQKGREAKEAGIGQERVEELRQDAIDCRHMAFYLYAQRDVSAALGLFDAMDRPELVLPGEILEALAQARRM